MSTTSLRQHNGTVHWSITTRDCGCASLEHSWQHRGDVSKWFMQKTETLLNFGAHSGQLRHSLSGGVKLCLKRNKKAVCIRGSPLTTCPMSLNNIPLRLKVIPHSCYNQDEVQSDVRTQRIQAVEHHYSFFQSLNDFLPFRTTFQESDCVSGVGLNHDIKVQVAKDTHFRGYQFSFAIKQHY